MNPENNFLVEGIIIVQNLKDLHHLRKIIGQCSFFGWVTLNEWTKTKSMFARIPFFHLNVEAISFCEIIKWMTFQTCASNVVVLELQMFGWVSNQFEKQQIIHIYLRIKIIK